jgi:hypothetical protein
MTSVIFTSYANGYLISMGLILAGTVARRSSEIQSNKEQYAQSTECRMNQSQSSVISFDPFLISIHTHVQLAIESTILQTLIAAID